MRVYQDSGVEDDDDYTQNAIELATDCWSGYEVEMLEEEDDVYRISKSYSRPSQIQ